MTFHGFLKSFLWAQYRRNCTLARIIDNALYHKKQKLQPFYAESKKRPRRLWLPPYSPNLNPIKRSWRLMRRQVTYNQYFETVDQLRRSLNRFFSCLSRPNVTLRSRRVEEATCRP